MHLNGHPYPMPSSPHTGHGLESRLGAVEAAQGIQHQDQRTIFGWLRELERRVTTIEAKAPSNRSSKPRELGGLLQLVRPLRDLIWALLFLLAGLGMISFDQPTSLSISASAPSSGRER